MCEGLIQILSLQTAGISSSQVVVPDAEKDDTTFDEDDDISTADEDEGDKYKTSCDDDSFVPLSNILMVSVTFLFLLDSLFQLKTYAFI